MGISTVATGKLESIGMTYYTVLLASAYISTIVLIALRIFSPFALISFISIQEAYRIVKNFNEKIPLNSDQQTAQLALHFGVLLTLGELLNVLYLMFF